MKFLSKYSIVAVGAGLGMLVAGLVTGAPGLWQPGVAVLCLGAALFGVSKVQGS